MVDKVSRKPAHDPRGFERLLFSREMAGDVDGMTIISGNHLSCAALLRMTSVIEIRVCTRLTPVGTRHCCRYDERELLETQMMRNSNEIQIKDR